MAETAAAAARKRKSEAAPGMDEADRALYSAFSSAANSLSHLYSQSVALQKNAFRAGEIHALEKLSQWMRRKHAEESRLTVAHIMAHIEDEMDNGGTDVQAPQRVHQCPQSAGQFANSSYHQQLAGSRGSNGGEHPKSTAMFSNALSSPARQKYHHPTQGGRAVGNGDQNTTKANTATSSDDTAMDMV